MEIKNKVCDNKKMIQSQEKNLLTSKVVEDSKEINLYAEVAKKEKQKKLQLEADKIAYQQNTKIAKVF
jgi:hypothetical protein